MFLDSSILGSRLAIILDDLLWVLTDFQLKAALHFIDSLVGLIQKSTEITRKRKAARKLEVNFSFMLYILKFTGFLKIIFACRVCPNIKLNSLSIQEQKMRLLPCLNYLTNTMWWKPVTIFKLKK